MSSNHFRFKKIIYDRVDDADVKVTCNWCDCSDVYT